MTTPQPTMPAAGTAAERAYDALRAGILDGTHSSGAMLSESVLAAGIGVSRTPVRAALARLADEGWVRVYPKRGVLVQEMDVRAASDLAQARVMLETTGVQHADTAGRRALADALRPHLTRQSEALAAGDLALFIELTLEFHGSFVAAGGNPVLVELGLRLGDRQRFLLRQDGDLLIARRVEVMAEHTRLVDALAADDVAGFTQALRAHVADTHGLQLS